MIMVDARGTPHLDVFWQIDRLPFKVLTSSPTAPELRSLLRMCFAGRLVWTASCNISLVSELQRRYFLSSPLGVWSHALPPFSTMTRPLKNRFILRTDGHLNPFLLGPNSHVYFSTEHVLVFLVVSFRHLLKKKKCQNCRELWIQITRLYKMILTLNLGIYRISRSPRHSQKTEPSTSLNCSLPS